jgi:nucleotide-binding universal stress UspA family protein
MYRKVLLAYDGSVEGRLALREGARLAQICGAEVILLAVVDFSTFVPMEAATVPIMESERRKFEEVLAEGAQRLEALGISPTTRLEVGSPAAQIGAVAREYGADLVVVGHRRQGALARWWFGSTSSYLTDSVDCTVLIARKAISDAEFASFTAGEDEAF